MRLAPIPGPGRKPYVTGDSWAFACNQCNRLMPKLLAGFNQRTKTWYKNCPACRLVRSENERQGVWKMKSWRSRTSKDELLRVQFIRESGNKKTGPIPVTTSSPHTCPPTCAWYGNGCYAEGGYIGGRWRKISETGMTWNQLCEEIRKLPEGQLWRHNEAGDLPGLGETVDIGLLGQLVKANEGRRGFTYTHKRGQALKAAALATRDGFTVNISCDSVDEVDELASGGERYALTVVVPADEQRKTWLTPKGFAVVRCPATYADIDCLRCKLCANGTRKSVIAFPAHGNSKNRVSTNSVQRRLPFFSEHG